MNGQRRISMRIVLLASLVIALAGTAGAREKTKAQEKREEIDLVAEGGLGRLFIESPSAKDLYDKAYGYAVFSNIKISLMISAGGGNGVAIKRDSEERYYMKMGTAGLNIGVGGQRYQVIFLFENAKTFNDFVDKGWQADASANAVAGKKGLNKEVSFVNGIAVFQFTQAGLMLQVDISGTKYWLNKRLNKK